jgi:hypothetical protein
LAIAIDFSFIFVIGGIAYWFAVLEQKSVKSGPIDLDEDTRAAKREASSQISNPTKLMNFLRMSAFSP